MLIIAQALVYKKILINFERNNELLADMALHFYIIKLCQ